MHGNAIFNMLNIILREAFYMNEYTIAAITALKRVYAICAAGSKKRSVALILFQTILK